MARKITLVFTFYGYKKCSTCVKAVRWLEARGIPFVEKAIRETPPNLPELKAALQASGNNLRKILNTSGIDYRELKMKDSMTSMTTGEVLTMISQNGNLAKRPLLIGKGIALVGFVPSQWEQAFKSVNVLD